MATNPKVRRRRTLNVEDLVRRMQEVLGITAAGVTRREGRGRNSARFVETETEGGEVAATGRKRRMLGGVFGSMKSRPTSLSTPPSTPMGNRPPLSGSTYVGLYHSLSTGLPLTSIVEVGPAQVASGSEDERATGWRVGGEAEVEVEAEEWSRPNGVFVTTTQKPGSRNNLNSPVVEATRSAIVQALPSALDPVRSRRAVSFPPASTARDGSSSMERVAALRSRARDLVAMLRELEVKIQAGGVFCSFLFWLSLALGAPMLIVMFVRVVEARARDVFEAQLLGRLDAEMERAARADAGGSEVFVESGRGDMGLVEKDTSSVSSAGATEPTSSDGREPHENGDLRNEGRIESSDGRRNTFGLFGAPEVCRWVGFLTQSFGKRASFCSASNYDPFPDPDLIHDPAPDSRTRMRTRIQMLEDRLRRERVARIAAEAKLAEEEQVRTNRAQFGTFVNANFKAF
ncbi:hypothetical protein BC936DRAFT_143535, partial [Jimgerdemannia flammicorona]